MTVSICYCHALEKGCLYRKWSCFTLPSIPQKPRVTADRVLPQLRLDEETEEEEREGGGGGGRFLSPPGSPTLELKVPLQPANLLRSVSIHLYRGRKAQIQRIRLSNRIFFTLTNQIVCFGQSAYEVGPIILWRFRVTQACLLYNSESPKRVSGRILGPKIGQIFSQKCFVKNSEFWRWN